MCVFPVNFAERQLRPARQRGLTFMEMIIAIVVIAILGVALLTAMMNPLTGAGTQEDTVFLTQLAQGRMEAVLGQKRREGFPGSDPCPGGAALTTCNVPAGYTVTTSFGPWSANPDTDEYQVVTVSVTGPGGSHDMHTLVANLSG